MKRAYIKVIQDGEELYLETIADEKMEIYVDLEHGQAVAEVEFRCVYLTKIKDNAWDFDHCEDNPHLNDVISEIEQAIEDKDSEYRTSYPLKDVPLCDAGIESVFATSLDV